MEPIVKNALSNALIAMDMHKKNGGYCYPPELWEKIKEAIKENGLSKTCKFLNIQSTYVANKLNLPRVYRKGKKTKQSINHENNGFAVYEIQKNHNAITSKIEIEMKGARIEIELKEQKIDWVNLFQGLSAIKGETC